MLDRSKYDSNFNALVTDAHVKEVGSQLDALGVFESAEYVGPTTVPGAPAGTASYVYRMICENGRVYVQISLTADDTVAGILFSDVRSGLNPK